jgi:hypothetical protein
LFLFFVFFPEHSHRRVVCILPSYPS